MILYEIISFLDINILIGTNAEAISGSVTDESDVTSEFWLYNVTEKILTEAFPQLYGKVNDQIIDRMSKVCLAVI